MLLGSTPTTLNSTGQRGDQTDIANTVAIPPITTEITTILLLRITIELSDAGPSVFSMKREHNPGVRRSDFVGRHSH